MIIDVTFNIWENSLAVLSIIISVFVSIYIYKLDKKISKREKYEHERQITEKLQQIGRGKSVILSDSKKYPNYENDRTNECFYEKGAEILGSIPGYGYEFIIELKSKDTYFIGFVPFEWIEYIREDGDGANSKPIIICKFKGERYYKRHKSPFKKTYNKSRQ